LLTLKRAEASEIIWKIEEQTEDAIPSP